MYKLSNGSTFLVSTGNSKRHPSGIPGNHYVLHILGNHLFKVLAFIGPLPGLVTAFIT